MNCSENPFFFSPAYIAIGWIEKKEKARHFRLSLSRWWMATDYRTNTYPSIIERGRSSDFLPNHTCCVLWTESFSTSWREIFDNLDGTELWETALTPGGPDYIDFMPSFVGFPPFFFLVVSIRTGISKNAWERNTHCILTFELTCLSKLEAEKVTSVAGNGQKDNMSKSPSWSFDRPTTSVWKRTTKERDVNEGRIISLVVTTKWACPRTTTSKRRVS